MDMQTDIPSIYATENPMYTTMRAILVELQNHPLSWPFLQPVKIEDVADYYSVIKNPMGEYFTRGRASQINDTAPSFSPRLEYNGAQARKWQVSNDGPLYRGCIPYVPQLPYL
jgi:hypothetical protein